jgi:DNA-binding HxlR family transcriptional regulator
MAYLKPQQKLILEVLKELGGKASYKQIADARPEDLHPNGVSQSFVALERTGLVQACMPEDDPGRHGIEFTRSGRIAFGMPTPSESIDETTERLF